jgi:ribosome-associated translation inhibitor RaiA/cold shock CspA family protein
MPDGVVAWFDTTAGVGRIDHAGHRYAVSAKAIEPAARVAGARVHFDIDHDTEAATAANVQLREGTRVARRQRRFGDLVGARAPDAKGTPSFVQHRPELGRGLAHRPMRVVEGWAAFLAAGELDEAMSLYAPDASMRVEGQVLVGPDAIRRHWATSPLLGGPAPAEVRGEDDVIVVRWAPHGSDGDTTETRLQVAHGEIADQWLGAVWAVAGPEADELAILMSVAGEVSEVDRAYALDKVRKVIEMTAAPVLAASIRLQQAPDPARERPALARVTVDLDGEPIRAHVAAHTMGEAVDLLEERLAGRIRHLAGHLRALRRRGPSSEPGQWRHGDWPEERPGHYPRPVDEREIVRHKTASPGEVTIDEAVLDLEELDHDFHLFADLGTGQDAVVHRLPGGSYRVQYLLGPLEPTAPLAAVPVTLEDRPAPSLDLAAARERLDVGPEPWVFFEDTDTGRGHLLYRRYDGHYGLVTPIDTPEATPGTKQEGSGP